MKSLALVLLIAAAAACAGAASGLEAEFQRWMYHSGKVYTSEAQYNARFAAFTENWKFVQSHDPSASYSVGLNKFADLSRAEWAAFVRNVKRPAPSPLMGGRRHAQRTHPTATAQRTPSGGASVDWRSLVGPVINQGQCGSSPYWGAIDAVTALWTKVTGLVIPLSVQQIMDCSSAEGNMGCDGGFMTYTFQYIIDNKGICSAEEYPYTAASNAQCAAANCTNVARITAYTSVPPNDEPSLLAAVTNQPVATAINAECQSVQFYTGGVLDDPTCIGQADHGISVFGYGTDSAAGKDYWLLRNSWGVNWGEAGYLRLVRGKNQCDLTSLPSYPNLILAEDEQL